MRCRIADFVRMASRPVSRGASGQIGQLRAFPQPLRAIVSRTTAHRVVLVVESPEAFGIETFLATV
jgi:hypothetical protein